MNKDFLTEIQVLEKVEQKMGLLMFMSNLVLEKLIVNGYALDGFNFTLVTYFYTV